MKGDFKKFVKSTWGYFLLLLCFLLVLDHVKNFSGKIIERMKAEKENRAAYIGKPEIEIKDGEMTPEVLLSFGRMSDPQVSPDGKHILFGVSYTSISDNRSCNNLYISDIDGSNVRQLTKEGTSFSNARWSADGKAIAFIQKGQIWTAEIRESGDGGFSLGRKVQVSDIPAGVSQFAFSPDYSRIMYVSMVQSSLNKPSDLYSDLDKTDAISADDLMYRHWDHWVKEVPHTFIAGFSFGKKGKMSITPDNSTDILAGEREVYELPAEPFGGIEQLAWSPDGKTVAYSCRKLTGKRYAFSTNTEIYLYDVETGACTQVTHGGGYDTNPVWSPDGSRLCWVSMERDGYEADRQRLMVASIDRGNSTTGTEGDATPASNPLTSPLIKKVTEVSKGFKYNVSAPVWGENPDEIYFSALAEGIQGIFRAFTGKSDGKEGWSIERITGEDLWYDFNSPFHISTSDGVTSLLADYSSMDFPAEMVEITIGGKPSGAEVPHSKALKADCPVTGRSVSVRQISNVNGDLLSQLEPAETEARYIKTTDGKDMLTWVVYPPHFDKDREYPSILICLGGPQGTLSQGWSYRWNYRLMAAQGYVTVLPNRRGTTAFGQEWTEQISGDYPGQNMQDYLSAAKALKAEPYIGKMAACGASYGGYSIYYLSGIHGDVFDAFIAHAGIFNEEHMYMTTEEMWFANWDNGGLHEFEAAPEVGTDKCPVGPAGDGQTFGGIRQGGSPWSTAPKAVKHYALSPHKLVTNWHTPILVTHGGMDFRVPADQGMAAYNSAQLMGVPSRLIIFPEENHWILRPQNALYWHREYFRWLDRWCKGQDSGMIRINAFIEAEPGKTGAVLDAAKALTEGSRKDAGCIAYDILQNIRKESSMIICETWQDEKALSLHQQAPHFKEYVPEMRERSKMATDIFTFGRTAEAGTPVRENISIETSPESAPKISEILDDFAAEARRTGGCLGCEVFKSATSEGMFLVCSTWENYKPLQTFRMSETYRQISENSQALSVRSEDFPLE